MTSLQKQENSQSLTPGEETTAEEAGEGDGSADSGSESDTNPELVPSDQRATGNGSDTLKRGQTVRKEKVSSCHMLPMFFSLFKLN